MTIAKSATVPQISEPSALEMSVARIARVRALKDAIKNLHSDDLDAAQAEELALSFKVQTSEAEEQAIAALIKICQGRNTSPNHLMKVHACGSDYEHALCLLEPFKPEKRGEIINVAQARYRDTILKS